MLQLEYSIGNSKIGTDTLIINLSSAKNCSAGLTGQCNLYQAGCYNDKAERQYPNVPLFRDRQENYWYNTDIWTKIEQLGQAFKKHKKVTTVRFNVSGDIKNHDDINQFIKLAQSFPDYVFYTYTHAKNELTSWVDTYGTGEIPKNLTINTSDFFLTGLNMFKIDFTFDLSIGKRSYIDYKKYKKALTLKALVCGGDCSKCSLCKVTHGKTINCPLH